MECGDKIKNVLMTAKKIKKVLMAAKSTLHHLNMLEYAFYA